jgi:hypothetical protein
VNSNVLNEIVRSYTSALSNGVKHLYESLPRVITIWANTGGKLHELQTSGKSDKARKDMMLSSFNNFNENLSNENSSSWNQKLTLFSDRKSNQTSPSLCLLCLLQQPELQTVPPVQACVHNDQGYICQSSESLSLPNAVETGAYA